MAVGINSIWECRQGATASNVNGAGFNPENANMLTDLTTDTNTGNTASPVVSSASYNFAAGDVSAYVFIQAGTSWLPGWYQIASVASNKATLTAGVGTCVLYTSGATRSFALNTLAGVASVATPTSGTWTIDYSQQNTAPIAAVTNFTAVGSSTTMTSVSAPFTKAMIGNFYHQTTTGTGAFGVVGWYELVNVGSTSSVTLDRTPNSGTASVACTGYVGGAASLQTSSGATDDSFFENGLGTNASGAHVFFVKNGSYSGMGSISLSASGGTQAPIRILGYNSLRTDGLAASLGSNRPTLAFGTNFFTLGTNWDATNLSVTGSGTNLLTAGTSSRIVYVKAVYGGTTANQPALTTGGNNCFFLNCEGVSYRGRGLAIANATATVENCWLHDSDIGLIASTASTTIIGNLIANNVTTAISFTQAITGQGLIQSNTLYGSENKTGIGVSILTATTNLRILNNIIAGFVSGVVHADTQSVGYDDFNCFYNNTTDVTKWAKGPNDSALNPSFTNVTQITGTTAVILTSNRIQDTSKNFTTLGVIANQDFVYYKSGSGAGVVGIYAITAITTVTNPNDTLTVDLTLTGNATGDHAYQITVGNNFAVGGNMKGAGSPGVFPGSLTTGYLDIGAAQRQETVPNIQIAATDFLAVQA